MSGARVAATLARLLAKAESVKPRRVQETTEAVQDAQALLNWKKPASGFQRNEQGNFPEVVFSVIEHRARKRAVEAVDKEGRQHQQHCDGELVRRDRDQREGSEDRAARGE